MNGDLLTREWLQTNRYGSFAMGCVDRIPRRKYHSLLTVREPGFGEPLNTVADIAETFFIQDKSFELRNLEQVKLTSFEALPSPRWVYNFNSMTIERAIEFDQEHDIVRILYKIKGVKEPAALTLEPLLAYRPIHSLTKENPFLNGTIKQERDGVSMEPYAPLPRLFMKVTGKPAVFASNGHWNKNIFHSEEHFRGYNSNEDLFVPGAFRIAIKGDTNLVLHIGARELAKSKTTPLKRAKKKPGFTAALQQAARQFLITKKNGEPSIIAGYPWFDDWARDTLICLPGFLLNPKNRPTAKRILQVLATRLHQTPLLNAPSLPEQTPNIMLDATLLFVRAVQLLGAQTNKNTIRPFMPVIYHLLEYFRSGTDSRVRITDDGLIFTHYGPYAVTWMDACFNAKPITPRHGYAVDLNAMFINAVQFALDWARTEKHTGFINTWQPLAKTAPEAFMKTFWSEQHGYLADTHDGQTSDFSLRPNQLWALALPTQVVPTKAAKTILEHVRKELLTPVGLRTLAPSAYQYVAQYGGVQRDRDFAYHQGSVWPWLLGIYADAINNVLGAKAMKAEIKPVIERLEKHFYEEACLGQISELFNADVPHAAGGAPAQAWSVAELLRITSMMKMTKDRKPS